MDWYTLIVIFVLLLFHFIHAFETAELKKKIERQEKKQYLKENPFKYLNEAIKSMKQFGHSVDEFKNIRVNNEDNSLDELSYAELRRKTIALMDEMKRRDIEVFKNKH